MERAAPLPAVAALLGKLDRVSAPHSMAGLSSAAVPGVTPPSQPEPFYEAPASLQLEAMLAASLRFAERPFMVGTRPDISDLCSPYAARVQEQVVFDRDGLPAVAATSASPEPPIGLVQGARTLSVIDCLQITACL